MQFDCSPGFANQRRQPSRFSRSQVTATSRLKQRSKGLGQIASRLGGRNPTMRGLGPPQTLRQSHSAAHQSRFLRSRTGALVHPYVQKPYAALSGANRPFTYLVSL
jgi:hypothetical protein